MKSKKKENEITFNDLDANLHRHYISQFMVIGLCYLFSVMAAISFKSLLFFIAVTLFALCTVIMLIIQILNCLNDKVGKFTGVCVKITVAKKRELTKKSNYVIKLENGNYIKVFPSSKKDMKLSVGDYVTLYVPLSGVYQKTPHEYQINHYYHKIIEEKYEPIEEEYEENDDK